MKGFERRTNFVYDKQQLQNQRAELKRKYGIFSALKNNSGFTSVDVCTPVTDRSLLSIVSSKDECKVSISVGYLTLMFSLVTE